MKQIFLRALTAGICQLLFFASLPVFAQTEPDTIEEKSRKLAREIDQAQKVQKTMEGITIHIQHRQTANADEIQNHERTLRWLKKENQNKIQQSRAADLDFLEEAELQERTSLMQQLENRRSLLLWQQKKLSEFLLQYHQLAESAAQRIRQLQQEHWNLQENSGFQEIETGGSFNQDALISEEAKIPVYQRSEPGTVQEEQPDISSDSKIPSTGGVRKSVSFGKACPAELLTPGEYDLDLSVASGDFILPVSGYLSAGTWAYPGGGMHLGMDMAAAIHTPVRAPASGIIVYADNPVSTNCGYIGNYCGWPYGSGNSIALLCVVNEKVYGISFFHLSSTLYVTPGQQVRQNDVIALSGNSGNSSGPHTHVEVFALSCSLEQAVQYFSSTADFAYGCGWEAGGTCSAYGCRIRPESVFF